jgi:hypothetical protein
MKTGRLIVVAAGSLDYRSLAARPCCNYGPMYSPA